MGKLVHQTNDVSIIDCNLCGFKHIIPFPEEKQLDDFYSNSFYEDYWGNYIEKHIEDAEWQKINYNDLYDQYELFLPEKGQRTLLDIGSGPGFFLKCGKDRGWSVTGIEPGKTAWKYSTAQLLLSVHNVFFNKDTSTQFGKFHVVNMNNVLEHLQNPRLILSLISNILEPNGLVSITSPNDFNPLQEAVINCCGKQRWWVDIKEHINYFDHSSLDALLTSLNFSPIYHTSSFPLELFILMGEDYIENPSLGKEIHSKRKRFEMAMVKAGKNQFKRDLYAELSKLGIGRELIIIARKNS